MRRKKQKNIDPKFKLTNVLSIDEIYIVINYVQLQKKKYAFMANLLDENTINNILRDLDIDYKIEEYEKTVRYDIEYFEKESYPDDIFSFEEYPDELPDENDCFQ